MNVVPFLLGMALAAAPACGQIFSEDFEGAFPGTWVTQGAPHATHPAAAHTGALGVRGQFGWIWNPTTTVRPGECLSVWTRSPSSAASGPFRTYLGFDASASGCKSFVFAPNTQDIRFQDNTGYGYVELSSQAVTLAPDTWYRMEVELQSGGLAVGRLFDSSGTNLLASVSHSFGSFNPGGVALRAGFNEGHDADDLTHFACAPSCTITSPTPGALVPPTVPVQVAVDDPESDPLTLTFEFSTDGGATWGSMTPAPTSVLSNPHSMQPTPASGLQLRWDRVADGVASGQAIQLRVTCSDGVTVGDCAVAVTAASPPLEITVPCLPCAPTGVAFAYRLRADGGLPLSPPASPYTWSAVTPLPAGLSLAPATGQLSGVPLASGSSTFTVRSTDASVPPLSVDRTFTLDHDCEATCSQALCGDCDENFDVNIADALMAVRRASGLAPPLAADVFERCNVAGARTPDLAAAITVLDGLWIAQAVVGLRALDCCGQTAPPAQTLACGDALCGGFVFGDPTHTLADDATTDFFDVTVPPFASVQVTLESTSEMSLWLGAPGTLRGDPNPGRYALSDAAPTLTKALVLDEASLPDASAYWGSTVAVAVHAARPGDYVLRIECLCYREDLTPSGTATGDTGQGLDLLSSSCGGLGTRERVYRYEVTIPFMDVTFSLDRPGTAFDTILSILDECTGDELACDDDGGSGTTSVVTLPSAAPGVYTIVVDGHTEGAYEILVTEAAAAPYCSTVEGVVPPAGPWPHVVTGFSGATDDDTVTQSCGAGGGADHVYEFSPGATGDYDVFLCGPTTFDNVLEIRQSDCASGPVLGCSDSFCATSGAFTRLPLLTGETYYIVIDGVGGATGLYTLTVQPSMPGTVDLSVSGTMISGTTSVAPGESVTIDSTITNSGTASCPPFVERIVLSADAILDAGDLVLADLAHPFLPPATAFPGSPTVTIPPGTPAGTYFVGVLADADAEVLETDEGNNEELASNQLTVLPAVDLEATSVTGRAYATMGLPRRFERTIENLGNQSSGPFEERWVLSTDSVVTAADVLVGTFLHAGLAPTTPEHLARDVAIPNGLAPGDYFIGVILDAAAAIAETDETNNALAASNAVPITVEVVDEGTLQVPVGTTQPAGLGRAFAVPSGLASWTLTAAATLDATGEPAAELHLTHLRDPLGTVLLDGTSCDPAGKTTTERAQSVVAFSIPNGDLTEHPECASPAAPNPTNPVKAGNYRARFSNLATGPTPGDVTIALRSIWDHDPTPATGTLHLNVILVGDLAVNDGLGAGATDLEDVLDDVGAMFAPAGISLATTRHTIPGALGDQFQIVDVGTDVNANGVGDDLEALCRLTPLPSFEPGNTGLNVFLVRHITPPGVAGVAAGIPGLPLLHGTSHSGVVVSTFAQPFSWMTPAEKLSLAKVIAHEIGHQLGLWHVTEFAGSPNHDPLPDTLRCLVLPITPATCTGAGAGNLMFPAVPPHPLTISPQQGFVLRASPAVR